jgi:hypothetical protein
LLSEEFWDHFRDRYGCDVVIQLRKYETFEKMLPSTIERGYIFSSFDAQIESWYIPEEDWKRTLDEREDRVK